MAADQDDIFQVDKLRLCSRIPTLKTDIDSHTAALSIVSSSETTQLCNEGDEHPDFGHNRTSFYDTLAASSSSSLSDMKTHTQLDEQIHLHSYNSQPTKEDLEKKVPYKHIILKETKLIMTGESSITSIHDDEPVLATFGVSTCIAVALYNPDLKRAALAHYDVSTSPQKLIDDIAERICELTDKQQIRVYLVSQDKEMISKYYSYLKNMGFPNHVFKTIKSPETEEGYSVGIDSKGGSFFCWDYKSAMDDARQKDYDYATDHENLMLEEYLALLKKINQEILDGYKEIELWKKKWKKNLQKKNL